MTTIAELAQSVFEDWRDADPRPDDFRAFVAEAAGNEVPSMTTTLFALVVDDNSLAFLDGPEETSEPFRCLAGAIGAEIERLACELVEARLATEASEQGRVADCQHCGRRIVERADGVWIDPNATGDDSIWRETCDAHDTFIADHEPADDAGDPWADQPDWPSADWQREVANGDTRLGYQDWVLHQREASGEAPEPGEPNLRDPRVLESLYDAPTHGEVDA